MVFLLLDIYRMSLSGKLLIETNKLIKNCEEAFQGVKATCDTALKTGDMGIFKKREVTCLRC